MAKTLHHGGKRLTGKGSRGKGGKKNPHFIARNKPVEERFTRAAMTKMARRAGVPSVGADCLIPYQKFMVKVVDSVFEKMGLITAMCNRKTCTEDDLDEAFRVHKANAPAGKLNGKVPM